jgi:hypothetical protein
MSSFTLKAIDKYHNKKIKKIKKEVNRFYSVNKLLNKKQKMYETTIMVYKDVCEELKVENALLKTKQKSHKCPEVTGSKIKLNIYFWMVFWWIQMYVLFALKVFDNESFITMNTCICINLLIMLI